MNYPLIEKFPFTLIIFARRLRLYFQARSIQVVTDNPLKSILTKSDYYGRLLKWSVKLNKFNILYSPRMTIKAQALTDFLMDFNNSPDIPVNLEPLCRLYVDDSSDKQAMGGSIVLKSSTRITIMQAIMFNFKAINNQFDHKTILTELNFARGLGASYAIAYSLS